MDLRGKARARHRSFNHDTASVPASQTMERGAQEPPLEDTQEFRDLKEAFAPLDADGTASCCRHVATRSPSPS